MLIDQDNIFTTYGKVNGDGVNVRSGASADSSSVGTVSKDSIVTVTGFENGWYSVTCQYGTAGYIRSDFVDLTETTASSSGNAIIDTAKQYLGTRYEMCIRDSPQ